MGIFADIGLGSAGTFIDAYWLMFVGYFLAALLVCFVGLITWFYGWRHPIEVRIFCKRGAIGTGANTQSLAVRVKSDIARIVTKDGIRHLKLFWNKKTMPMPEYRFVYSRGGIFRRFLLNLLEDDVGELHPISLASLEQLGIVFRPEPQNTKFWQTLSMKNAHDTWYKESWLSKYANIIFPMAYFTIFFVLSLILIYQIKDISAALSEVATALSSIPG